MNIMDLLNNLDFDTFSKIIASGMIICGLRILNSLSETDKLLKTVTIEVHQNNIFLIEDLKLKIRELDEKIENLENKIKFTYEK